MRPAKTAIRTMGSHPVAFTTIPRSVYKMLSEGIDLRLDGGMSAIQACVKCLHHPTTALKGKLSVDSLRTDRNGFKTPPT